MVAQFITALERPVSRVRLENYRNGGDDLAMVVNYFHNVELAEALYPSLQAFEIGLRNSIHGALSAHFTDTYWFERPGLLPRWQSEQIARARSVLMREAKPVTADRIIAELHFGFWHSLFNSPFERDLWRPNKAYLIGEVFPHSTRRIRNRQAVWERCDRIRKLRNRVMHYEPVWLRPSLRQDHADILDAIRWISVEMFTSVVMFDRFAHLLDTGRPEMERRIREEIARRSAT